MACRSPASLPQPIHPPPTTSTLGQVSWLQLQWFMGCILPEIPPDTAGTNPLLISYRDSLPQFEQINETHCFYGFGKALLEFESAICRLETLCESGQEVDFNTLFDTIEHAKCEFESVWNTVNLLHVTTDILDRDRFTKLHWRAERAFLTRVSSRTIYATLKRLKETHEQTGNLTPDQNRILERYLTEYKHKGFELDDKGYKEFTMNWLKKLSEAKRDYNYKIMTLTQRFRTSVNDDNVAREFPIDVLKAMAVDSSQPTKGPWNVTLHPYIYRKFLEYCPDRRQRWNLYQAYVSRGDRKSDSEVNILPQLKDIRILRQDQSVTLGYRSFAEISMETKMAAHVDNVKTMITSLLGSAKDAQERELDQLQEYAESRGFESELTYFDIPYFKRKFRRTYLGLADDDVRDFFPLPRVMSGLIQLSQQYFNVQIEEIQSGFESWHKDVKFYRVVDANQHVLGQFYFDPYLRDDKGYPGGDKGWYVPVRPHSVKAACQPLGAMVLSLPVPGYGKPSLLNYDEVREMFRIFGNMLIHLLSAAKWSDLSGKTNLEWDALDLVSNFMIQMSEQPKILTTVSGHWSSNESISSELAAKICKSKQHLAGFELCGELFKSAYDIAFHDDDANADSAHGISEILYPQYLLIPRIKEDSFPLNFAEVIGGDLAGAYFCGTWSRMLAADAFSAVKEAGMENEDDVRKITQRFRSTFLAVGSAQSMAETFRQFRGRDPSHEALLVSLGLKEIPKPKKRGHTEEEARA
eukprot:maker-scaffold109_size355148-snap-gene-1.29 protein:Tk11036 transcript:maker-scaffold109_size355148-snap-gene-1.29-mRNA-1 annotation:"oligopeptidase a"